MAETAEERTRRTRKKRSATGTLGEAWSYTPAGWVAKKTGLFSPGDPQKELEQDAIRAQQQYEALGGDLYDKMLAANAAAGGIYGQGQGALSGVQDVWGSIYGEGGQGAGPGYSEEFYRSLSGADPFGFERRQSAERINAEANARGGYNSGAALAAQAMGNAAFDDRLMQYRGQLAGQSDAAKQARLNQMMGSRMQIGGAQAGLYGDQARTTGQLMGQGAQLYGGALGQGIDARYTGATNRAQGETANQARRFDLFKGGVQAFAGGA